MLLTFALHLARASLWLVGFKSHRVPTSAGTVHALVRPARDPAAPPLVLLHGIAAAGAEFGPALRQVARAWPGPVVVPDLPAHGFSEVPPQGLSPATLHAGLVESLDQLLDRPALLFGNSLGGLAVVRYALASPGRVRALLLDSPGGAGMDEPAFQRFLDRFRMPTLADAHDFVDRLYARRPWYARLVAGAVRQRFHAAPMRSFLATLRATDLLTPAQLGALPAPVVLLWGRSDRLMPRENLDFYRAHLPAGTEVVEPDAFGHCPHLDTPARLAEHILTWATAQAAPATA